MNEWQSNLVDFHEKFGLGVSGSPCYPSSKVSNLRAALIEEEAKETIKAIVSGDLVELADGIADTIYVLLGTAVEYGIDIDPIWREVHRTNMLKVGGAIREDGKILKPNNWQPPNIKKILLEQGMINENQSQPSNSDSHEK